MLEFTTSAEGKLAAGVCVGITVLMSGVLILRHLLHYKHPILQRYAIRIILMVPVYAVDSYISLWVPEFAFYINSCRDVYEAYVIYNFVAMVRAPDPRPFRFGARVGARHPLSGLTAADDGSPHLEELAGGAEPPLHPPAAPPSAAGGAGPGKNRTHM